MKKRIIFEQSDEDNFSYQLEMRRRLIQQNLKDGSKGLLDAASFIAPILIVFAVVCLYSMFK